MRNSLVLEIYQSDIATQTRGKNQETNGARVIKEMFTKFRLRKENLKLNKFINMCVPLIFIDHT
jgi:hypothetical protein